MLTHINEKGYAKMVDISEKDDTKRTAVATATITLSQEALEKVKNGQIKKGDVLSVAQVAGIMGAKNTSSNIPMCHQIKLVGCDLEFDIDDSMSAIRIFATCKSLGKTGVEMEALSACSLAALTIYDMCKAVDKKMVISNIHLVEKTGGKSGDFKFE
ncbi:cyclic pyranopterin monophosphate synthase MoaC [Clostridioides sp. ES-S-0108-01]|uniref:cyclic pyranopterin monophosphate synthase MoaC n=1 Tax=unclassified Clostridioides TaxID=2635829 RepID=UPI001D0C8C74|nr:cyclic pyranopterin monophosphate synthase MoaC [Clostridioides sp. ES-S-0171-01]MCC0687292.1 cyclic pyranopterin monophosphate synthase MoaC [Clostridioides sp. ES-S-0056-01]MCC0782320.1 cyclic pyranopterin monophosphate synthase MoaC [Clostridioides sp. ES-S-0108-01]UDN52697.1 cyclic pyranopterin monophosphate synthase MoaC [Clostridioides sp. ES-S-0107-01]UDN56167.1 cyclic pyranopterin monophosphate synthase MoaC [Clostridioides sp. ES-S-0054-01]